MDLRFVITFCMCVFDFVCETRLGIKLHALAFQIDFANHFWDLLLEIGSVHQFCNLFYAQMCVAYFGTYFRALVSEIRFGNRVADFSVMLQLRFQIQFSIAFMDSGNDFGDLVLGAEKLSSGNLSCPCWGTPKSDTSWCFKGGELSCQVTLGGRLLELGEHKDSSKGA